MNYISCKHCPRRTTIIMLYLHCCSSGHSIVYGSLKTNFAVGKAEHYTIKVYYISYNSSNDKDTNITKTNRIDTSISGFDDTISKGYHIKQPPSYTQPLRVEVALLEVE